MSPSDSLEVEIAQGIHTVPQADWDSLVGRHDPFMTHAFLTALESSGSATADTGWLPLHVLCRRHKQLIGAAPLYLKNHSYGEYIFDWSWAQAAQRAGLRYYPKLVCAVPFTPATGTRLLVSEQEDPSEIRRALVGGMMHVAQQAQASSLHILFCTEQERETLSQIPGLHGRLTHQFHWNNPGIQSFEEWLNLLRSRRRKETRRERRRAQELGVEIRVLRGRDITPRYWQALEGFYRDTVEKKWGEAYLSPDFFQIAADTLHPMAIAVLGIQNDQVVAGALAFQRGDHLIGRYWGCRPGFERLHFEICYHRPIELCITEGWTKFEAGAQGHHKLSRGLMPAATHSLHWIRHPGLENAVRQAVHEESEHVRQGLQSMAKHGPFRREC